MPELAKENYGNHVTVDGAQTVTGAKTFSGGAAIAGRTTVATTGYIGETKTTNCASVTTTYGSTPATVASLSLEAGTWLVCAEDSAYNNVLGPGGTIAAGGSDLYNSTDAATVISTALVALSAGTATQTDSGYFKIIHCIPIVLTGTKTIQFRVLCTGVSGTPTGATAVSRGYGKMTAIRIA